MNNQSISVPRIAAFAMALLMSCAPAFADQTIALARGASHSVVPTAPFGTTVRERMRDRAITRELPSLALNGVQRAQVRTIQTNFRTKRPGTRGASEPELAAYHAQLLNILTPTQREQLRVKMKRHWIQEHTP